jgi:uncharacterized protein
MLSKWIGTAELKELAGQGARLELSLNVEDLTRLAEFVVKPGDGRQAPGQLAARIRFENGSEGYPRMRISVTGSLILRCQRCLRPVEWSVHVRTRLTVLGSDAQATQLAEPFDSIVMSADGLRLAAVIEDEILAALPMAPVHEPGVDCVEAGAPNVELQSKAEQTYRPFAGLATRVAGGGKDSEH